MDKSEPEVYLPLISDGTSTLGSESQSNYHREHERPTKKLCLTRKEVLFCSVILVQIMIILGLVFFNFTGPRQCGDELKSCGSSSDVGVLHLYSPANEILEDQIKVFSNGLTTEQISIYQDYSDESDEAWLDLYDRTIMRVPKSEAELLPNRTWPLKEYPEYYIAQLDVFHQLHCLNKLRQGLRKDRYDQVLEDAEEELAPFHLSHCVDSLRQYIMCHSDPAVVIWEWDPEDLQAKPSFEYPHMCKNFDKLRDWAAQRHIDRFDPTAYVDNDLPIPPIIH